MKNNQISKIAQAAHTSNSTVSKVLHHCGGVGSETRDRVYTYAAASWQRKHNENALPTYALFPETPNFFWNCTLQNFDDLHRVKYNIYSRLGDDAMVLRYLQEAIALRSRVIIVAATLNEEARTLLRRVSVDALILFLTEYNAMVNTFYIGSDAAADGKLLANACKRECLKGSEILVLKERSDSETREHRLSAFLQTAQNDFVCDVKEIEIDPSRFSPALLARSLAPQIEGKNYAALVCCNGYLPQICSALRKLRRPLPCFGFEHFAQESEYAASGYLKAVVCQNFQRQLDTALAVAREYLDTGNAPGQKAIYVPSDLVYL